jgi:hypothetical protein
MLSNRFVSELIISQPSLLLSAHAGSSLTDFSTLKMEAIRSSETTIHFTGFTRRHIPVTVVKTSNPTHSTFSVVRSNDENGEEENIQT